MTKKQVSRQYRWKQRQKQNGLCAVCGRKREHYATLCDEHQIAERERNRKARGFNKHRPGGRGRPPIVDPE